MSEAPRNVLTVWARLIASSLVSAGVRDVVVSPGSRSTPFVLALRERSELRLTSALDERAAAFVALGIGRVTGRAAAVLATSGTAPAHWFPAAIEASLSGVPLLLLSANRPLDLANAGAAQTIDQTKLFGSWVRLFVDLGDPTADERAMIGLVRNVGLAVATAHGVHPGPVHVDLHADKPLELREASSEAEVAIAARASRVSVRGVTPVTYASRGPDAAFAEQLADALARAERPILVAGPHPGSEHGQTVHAACDQLGVWVAAEASSQLRFGTRGRFVLDASEVLYASERFANDHAPDLVIQVGRWPTAPTLERAWAGAARFVLDAGGIHDPLGTAAALSLAPAAPTLELAARAVQRGERDPRWVAALRRAEAISWSEVERSVASGRGEGPVVRAACAAARDATWMLGNSLAIRTVDRFVPGGGRARRVLSQRGANGIDGLVSGAIGAAIGGERPVLALVGDVSFVHDLNALVVARAVRSPLVVVVVDNGGGRIFESLPIAREATFAEAMPLFTTPHDVDLCAAVRAFGVACVETKDADETGRAVAVALERAEVTVVRAVVDPHDADAAFRRLVANVETRFYGGAP